MSFAPEELGMTAYFCSRYENRKGEARNWGLSLSSSKVVLSGA
jgi:hypothetical protein